jgi:hypothetical protein
MQNTDQSNFVPCRRCGEAIDSKLPACPHCGVSTAENDLALAKHRLDWLIEWLQSDRSHRIQQPIVAAAPWVLFANDGAIVSAWSAGELLDAAIEHLPPVGSAKQVHLDRTGKVIDLVF